MFSSSRILFVPYIDIFVWVYLLLTGQFRYRVCCFNYAFVPQLFFFRLSVTDLEVETFLARGREAIQFLDGFPREMDVDRPIEINGNRLPIELLNIKERARFFSDIFLAMKLLSPDRLDRSNNEAYFYLPCSFMDEPSLNKLKTRFTDETGFVGKKSAFLDLVHPLIMEIVAFFAVLYKMLKDALGQNQIVFANAKPRILFSEVSPSEANLDPTNQLSAAFLIDEELIGKDDVIFVIWDQTVRSKWRRRGYHVTASITELSGRPALKDILKLFSSRCMRHYSFVRLRTFLDPLEMLCSLKSVNEGMVSSLIYSNSCYGFVPAMVLPFRALRKSITMIWYSAAMYDGHNFSLLLADQVMVWNTLMKKFVEKHPQHDFMSLKVVGPAMFANDEGYSRQNGQKRTKRQLSRPALIGVYPVHPQSKQTIDAARIATNYTERFFNEFMRDISSLSSLGGWITLKSKAKRKQPMERVFDLDRRNVQTEDPARNPYQSVAECALVICMPFSSIYYVALQLRIPAIYYTPIQGQTFGSSELLQDLIVTGRENLESVVRGILAGDDKYPNLTSGARAALSVDATQSTSRLIRKTVRESHDRSLHVML